MRPLAGVSLDTEATHDRHRFREATLFTHRGLSGPAILQISSYWREGPIVLNLLPDLDAAAFLLDRKRTRPKAELPTVLAEHSAATSGARAGAVPAHADGRHAGPRAAGPRRGNFRPGRSPPPAPRATRKPRSPPAASTRAICPRRPCRPQPCPACSSLAKRSMSPAGSAAIISNGPGPAVGAPGEAA